HVTGVQTCALPICLNTPDVIWQMAQKIKTHFLAEGKEVKVFVRHSKVRINGKKSKKLIDPKVDLAAEKWSHFKHHDWILDQNAPKDFYFDKSLIQKLLQSVHQK